MSIEPKYEEQFVAFLDFLGFSEASKKTDDISRMKILELLVGIASLRGEFDIHSTQMEGGGKSSHIKPAISTFSDHIVVSYPLDVMRADSELNERTTATTVFYLFNNLLTKIAAEALRIGFLIRGGATIGPLYHSQGVVFGGALIEAFEIESRTSVYPRVVLSSAIASRPDWIKSGEDQVRQLFVARDDDGLYYLDYYMMMVHASASTGENFKTELTKWFDHVIVVIERNLTELKQAGKLNELAKWTWFAARFRKGLERLPLPLLQAWGISLARIPWK